MFLLVLGIICTQRSAMDNKIFSNYWMRLSRIWRILQIKEGVIHRGRRPRSADLRDLQNSSYPTKAEFNNTRFIIHSKYFLLLKGVSPFRSLFFRSPNITQPCPQVFSVNLSIFSGLHFWCHFDIIGSIIFGGLHFCRHWFNMAKIFFSNLENSSWLWWIMRVVLTNQKQGNILNE